MAVGRPDPPSSERVPVGSRLRAHVAWSARQGDIIILNLFLLEDSFESAHNLKFILCAFEQMLGLKIKFSGSELSK